MSLNRTMCEKKPFAKVVFSEKIGGPLMKHSKPKERESQFSYGLDFQSKEIHLSQPIWYEHISSLCEDLKFFCRAYPAEAEFTILVKSKPEVI